jgi:predicted ATPase
MMRFLRLMNFKKFKDQLIEFRALTLISGLNSTGKSSILQSILLLRQSYQQNLLQNTGLALNGELANIGTAQDAFFENGKENYIYFEIAWESYKGIWSFRYNPDKKDEDVLNFISEPNNSEIYKLNIFSQYFHYLQAERIGPRSFNKMSDYQVRRLRQLGTQGEYTAHFLYIYGREPIPIANLSYPEAKSMDLIDQVEAWMREVSPGIRIEIKANSEMGLVTIQYFYGDSNRYRATNVGFGITYTLSIIVAILSSYPGTLILVENPEAHLHPRGQAKMGELLALAANCGVQVVIETHSDHVLNGIRLAVHGGKIKPEDVQLHYFQNQEKQGQIFTKVISPHIDRNGRIDRWPDGFFDEWERSLDVLLEPAGE